MKMKKKYILSLVFIGILLFLTLTIGTGYGLYISTNQGEEKSATTLNCFKAYFSHGNSIEMKNITPVVNEEGIESSPYTLTITNICNVTKELQVRLNITNNTTIDTKSLTINATGNIEKETTLYNNLKTTKTTDATIAQSKLIGLVSVEPNQTVRTNIKMWFDEKKSPTIEKTQVLSAKFELIDTESSIKATFAETLLEDIKTIESKELPNFAEASYKNEGLYKLETNEGKTYYYRGIVNNNYVKFANYIWRVVSINADNSVKLILDKSATTMNYSQYTSVIDYTGLKYLYNNEETNNDITNYLEEWYKINISDHNYDNYVTNSNFCNDSSYYINNYHTYFGAYNRIVTNKTPTITCPETNADFGGTYNQKIGLITVDEVAMAGGLYNVNNFNYYLYNGENYFTMSGAEYYGYTSYLFVVNNSGAITSDRTTSHYGIRPVINLDSFVTVSGSGTIEDPYTVDYE